MSCKIILQEFSTNEDVNQFTTHFKNLGLDVFIEDGYIFLKWDSNE